MRTRATLTSLVLVIVMLSLSPLLAVAQARSVHSTVDVDLFPQGTFAEAQHWNVGAETSFTKESATYTEAMVADARLTMLHTRPLHLDTMTVWSGTSPTDSNYSTGAPDGASAWSTGPDIQLTDFDVSGLSTYEMHEIHICLLYTSPSPRD